MARRLGCAPKWIRLLRREFLTPEGATRQLRAEKTWPMPEPWTDLRLERDKRKDDHGAKYRLPKIRRQKTAMLTERDADLKREVELQLRKVLRAQRRECRQP